MRKTFNFQTFTANCWAAKLNPCSGFQGIRDVHLHGPIDIEKLGKNVTKLKLLEYLRAERCAPATAGLVLDDLIKSGRITRELALRTLKAFIIAHEIRSDHETELIRHCIKVNDRIVGDIQEHRHSRGSFDARLYGPNVDKPKLFHDFEEAMLWIKECAGA
jgi:hypothetical protein